MTTQQARYYVAAATYVEAVRWLKLHHNEVDHTQLVYLRSSLDTTLILQSRRFNTTDHIICLSSAGSDVQDIVQEFLRREQDAGRHAPTPEYL